MVQGCDLVISCPVAVGRARETQWDFFVYTKFSESLREGWETDTQAGLERTPRVGNLPRFNYLLDGLRVSLKDIMTKFTLSLHLFAQIHRQEQIGIPAAYKDVLRGGEDPGNQEAWA